GRGGASATPPKAKRSVRSRTRVKGKGWARTTTRAGGPFVSRPAKKAWKDEMDERGLAVGIHGLEPHPDLGRLEEIPVERPDLAGRRGGHHPPVAGRLARAGARARQRYRDPASGGREGAVLHRKPVRTPRASLRSRSEDAGSHGAPPSAGAGPP